MAALDFPAAPINGQVFTGVGGINWVWDGAKWNPGTSLSAGQFVPLAGGTMTGPLVLSGPPTVPLHAASKAYVDGFLPLTGGVMTGGITIQPVSGSAQFIMKKSAAANNNEIYGATGASLRWGLFLGDGAAESGSNAGSNFTINRFNDAGAYIDTPISINRATGFVNIAGSPQNNVGRNLIHNPLFNIRQRGGGPWTTNNAYTADRWKLVVVGSGTSSVSVVGLGDGNRAAIGDEQADACLSNGFAGSATTGSYNYVSQGVEDVRRLAGKTVTLSFYANTSTTSPKLGINVLRDYGTGGSPSAIEWIMPTGLSITLSSGATFARYSVQITIPTIIGKTLGTNANSKTEFAFWYSASSDVNALSGNIGVQSSTINIWGVQLEIGSTMTPLEKPDPADDLAKCQRFFQVGTASVSAYAQPGWGSGGLLPFPVKMRAVPTITIIGTPSYTNGTAATISGWTPGFYTASVQAVAAGMFVGTFDWMAAADL